jgi:hypothetical protein
MIPRWSSRIPDRQVSWTSRKAERQADKEALDDLVFGGEDFNPRLEELDLEEYPDIPEPSGMPQPLFELSTGKLSPDGCST